jgi:D-alanyl-lipoteichoic acid acyltransferase DltB (MBOAT superfamily)
MSIATLPFAILLVVSLAVYWLGHRRRTVRTAVLVLASYVFYASANPWFLILLFYVSALDFWIGRRLGRSESPRARKLWVAASVTSSLSLLVVFKYLDFFAGVPADLAALFGIEWTRPEIRLPLPLGISFFVFQTISYVVDVYRRKIAPCERLLDYLLYIAFFPRIAVGPIVRAGQFLPQLAETPRLTKARFGLAVFLLISGFVKKLVIAEFVRFNLVDRVFDLPLFFSATETLCAAYAAVLQLYADFSGYMDIAIGIALLFGLELPENFNFPFKARNIRAFWRRWHITLSTWLRDYLFISLGGSRVSSSWKLYRNLLITMVLMGLWHGAAWNYVLMGLVFAAGLIVTHRLQGPRGPVDYVPGESKFLYVASVVATFHYLVVVWVIYKASSVQNVLDIFGRLTPFLAALPNVQAALVIKTLATGGSLSELVQDASLYFAKSFASVSNLSLTVVGVMAVGALGMWLPERIYAKIRDTFVRLPLPWQLLLAGLAVALIYKATAFQVTPFEYQRF